MALIVETGAIVPGAEAYRTVAAHKAYCDARGISYAAITDAQLEQDARKATAYLTGQYRSRWAGSRKSLAQVLDWPRYMVPIRDVPGGYATWPAYYSDTIVPTEIGDAQSELMIRVRSAELAPDLERGILREKVGPLETEYDPNSSQIVRFRAVDMLLKPFLKAGGGSGIVSLVRA